jgi:hypothetical protein
MNRISFPGLTGNQLKLIALITMTLDHVGMLLLPRVRILRAIGRIAFPIFAYMIAEGCQHTRNRRKYLLSMVSLAAICQVVYFFAMGSLSMCVLVTFSLSIGLIYISDYAHAGGRHGKAMLYAAGFALVFLCYLAHDVLFPKTDFGIEYGLWGVLLPVFAHFGARKQKKLQYFTAGLALLCLTWGGIQWFSMAAIPLIALYNGKRGKWKMKYLFYIYYPLHLVVLQGLAMVL